MAIAAEAVAPVNIEDIVDMLVVDIVDTSTAAVQVVALAACTAVA